MLTLILGVTGISFSLPIGIMLALGRQSKMPVLRILCVLFIEFIRGVPLITRDERHSAYKFDEKYT